MAVIVISVVPIPNSLPGAMGTSTTGVVQLSVAVGFTQFTGILQVPGGNVTGAGLGGQLTSTGGILSSTTT